MVFGQKKLPYNQLIPVEVGRVKGLRETDFTYRQINGHVSTDLHHLKRPYGEDREVQEASRSPPEALRARNTPSCPRRRQGPS